MQLVWESNQAEGGVPVGRGPGLGAVPRLRRGLLGILNLGRAARARGGAVFLMLAPLIKNGRGGRH